MNIIESNSRVALITGANSGIGRITARELALKGYHVFLACRSRERTQPVLDEIAGFSGGKARVEFLPLDLGDLDSVRQCADTFLARDLPLHLLICNAGLAGSKGLTKSGFELTFGTCHVGHFLLTQLLLECIRTSAPARIVVVASKAHRLAKIFDFASLRKTTSSAGGLKEYGTAKLANILFTTELARRLEGTGVTTYALHPGVVATDVWRSVPWPLDWFIKRFMITEEEGAATSLYCATEPSLATQSGLYYTDCAVADTTALAKDTALAARLWKESEQWVGLAR
jgi:NAD(P)-dependent dehydrogenase (short-subunit alcohol dehydrogenase family)